MLLVKKCKYNRWTRDDGCKHYSAQVLQKVKGDGVLLLWLHFWTNDIKKARQEIQTHPSIYDLTNKKEFIYEVNNGN